VPSVVHVVDDDVSFQTAIRRRLQLAGYEVRIYSSAEQFLDQQQPNDNRLGCLLLDVRMPGISGAELQGSLHEAGSTLPIVFVSAYENIQTTVQAIKAGAEDFLIKPVASDRLLPTIERAIARHDALRKLQSELDVLRAHVATLTPREQQVFGLVVQGKINKQIAFALGPTERTIKAHRQRVMEKMNVRSLAELVLIAERLGLSPARHSSSSGNSASNSTSDIPNATAVALFDAPNAIIARTKRRSSCNWSSQSA
jgi:FixJ family two-component response regulator